MVYYFPTERFLSEILRLFKLDFLKFKQKINIFRSETKLK